MLARSWLFVPGNSEKRLKKAETLDSDIFIFDLEDAVGLDEKENARIILMNALASSNKNVYVRVNSMDTPYFFEDLKTLFSKPSAALKGIMLPKAADAKKIHFLEQLLEFYERQTNLEERLEIVPLIESAIGVHNCFEIAISSERVHRLVFGAIDYALDVNIMPSSDSRELLYVRSQLANASRAAGIEPPIDTVYVDFGNKEGMEAETEQARKLGFSGKLAVHPSQIAIINKNFSPSESDILEAAEILAAAERQGESAFQLNGKMVDEPILKKARKTQKAARLLQQHEKQDGVVKDGRK